MKLYLIVDKDKLPNILATQFIPCDTETVLLYRKIPSFNENEVCFRISLNKYDSDNLFKLDKDIYYFLGGISLEVREYKIFVINDDSKGYILKMLDLYREVKYLDSIQLEVYNGKFANIVHYDTSKIEILNNIHEYENAKHDIYNSIKGFITGILYNNYDFKNLFIDKYPIYYSEYTSILHIKKRLIEQNLKSRKIMHQLNQVQKSLEGACLQATNKLCKHDLIFTMNNQKKISFQDDFFTIKTEEVDLLNTFTNYLLIHGSTKSPKDKLRKAILGLEEHIKKGHYSNIVINDLSYLLDRVNEKKFDTSIGDLKTILFKNLFALYIKIENFNELNIFLREKNIPDSNIALGAYGLCVGYDSLPGYFVKEYTNDFIFNTVFIDNLQFYERVYYDRTYNMYLTRYKIYYYINQLSKINYPEQDIEYNIGKINITINRKNRMQCIYLNNDDIGQQQIFVHERTNNISKSIRYFDKKIEGLKEMYDNFTYNDNKYFNYVIRKGNLRKMHYIQQEYVFSILLGGIVKFLEGELKGNETR